MNNRLTRIFEILSKKEKKKLKKLIYSPFFNQSNQLILLFEYLKEHYDKSDSPTLNDKELFENLFPGETFRKTKINNLMSDLSLLIDQFLLICKMQEDPILSGRLKVEVFGALNMYKRFEQEISKLDKYLVQRDLRNAEYHLDRYQLMSQHYQHPNTSAIEVGNAQLVEMIKHLDAFYLTEKLRYTCEMISREIALGEHYNDLLLNQLLDIASTYYGKENVVVELYRKLIQLLSNTQTKLFQEVKQLFFENITRLSSIEQRAVFQYLTNISFNEFKRGKKAYRKALFDLYKAGFNTKLYLLNNQISYTLFNNIIMTATSFGAFDWATRFIDIFQEYLSSESRENAISFGRAVILFRQKTFVEALEMLNRVEYRTERYWYLARSLKLRTLYEISVLDHSFTDVLFSFADAFERALRSKQVFANSTTRAYLKYIALVKRVKKYEVNCTVAIQKKLRRDALDDEQLIAREWLLEKINQLV